MPTVPSSADPSSPGSPVRRSLRRPVERALRFLGQTLRRHFRRWPRLWVLLLPALVMAFVTYARSPTTNFIFDEQEALLANPYVNGDKLTYLQAFKRDFWGFPPERTIGSYRPIPNLIWRPLFGLIRSPWWPHFVNVLLHALNASLVGWLAVRLSRRRLAGWLCAAVFVLSAVVTEAVCGVVGLADVLGGTFVLLSLLALTLPLPWGLLGVFAALTAGLFTKESVLVAVPLVALSALVLAPVLHPSRPLRLLRAVAALAAALGALVAYTYLRRMWFPTALPPELTRPLPETEPLLARAVHEFQRWFHQPNLPKDPINNPLAQAETSLRIAGALRVYARGWLQVFAPWTLSGDYSFPQEPIPKQRVFFESVLGAALMLGPPLTGAWLWLRSLVLERHVRDSLRGPGSAPLGPRMRRELGSTLLVALGLLWVPIAYFPLSNIPILLPTVRAERFWYLPIIGTSLLLGLLLAWIVGRRSFKRDAWLAVALFLGLQAVRARQHALDYRDDLSFWEGTRKAVPYSAKAHLNYSVMLGARGRLEERLHFNGYALNLAPNWPMAHVYYGDTLCRLKRVPESFGYLFRGFELNPNDVNLIALGLQCLWGAKAIDEPKQQELLQLASRHPGTWLAYLARDIVTNGEKHDGVDPKYRPRGYNAGPREQ